MNDLLCNDKNPLPPSTEFGHNGASLTDKTDIANRFNEYFACIGNSVAEQIRTSKLSFEEYVRKNPQIDNT